MDGQDKRRQRELKRLIKQAGSQRRRRQWKRDLQENPEEAPHSVEDFGRFRSAPHNGQDHDATRKTTRDSGE